MFLHSKEDLETRRQKCIAANTGNDFCEKLWISKSNC